MKIYRMILPAALLAVLPLGTQAARKADKVCHTPANDSKITYIARTEVSSDGSVSFDWSNSTVRVAFSGRTLAVKASDTHKDWFNLWIDREPSACADMVFTIAGDTTVVLASDLPEGEHCAVISKRTEGEQGTVTIHSFITEGPLLKAQPIKERLIEFVGDSYTCGYGSENSISSDPFLPETENGGKTYASILGRYFDADIITVAHSGQGIARNYDDNLRGWYMPERYGQTFDMRREQDWNARKSNLHPDITIIYLGTNDFSTSRQPSLWMFRENYTALLKSIKACYGENHPVLCVWSKCDPALADYIKEVVSSCGMANVSACGFFDWVSVNDDSELGASGHPNYRAHRKLAYGLIPYVSTATGWPLNNNPVE